MHCSSSTESDLDWHYDIMGLEMQKLNKSWTAMSPWQLSDTVLASALRHEPMTNSNVNFYFQSPHNWNGGTTSSTTEQVLSSKRQPCA